MISNYKRTEEHKENINSGIYCIINKINNKKYIGQTYDLEYRWKRHKSDLNNNNHSNNHLMSAWNKYGEDNFEFDIIEKCDLSIIDDREIYWINYYNCIKNGYNQCEGGLGCRGYKHTEQEIEKMRKIQNPKSVLQLDLNGNLIKEWYSASQSAKELGLYTLAIKNCCEQREYVKSVGQFIWIYKEDKDTINMNYYLTRKNNNKKVNQFNKEMELIKVWESIKQVSEITGYCYKSIANACNGRTKISHGFIWNFA